MTHMRFKARAHTHTCTHNTTHAHTHTDTHTHTHTHTNTLRFPQLDLVTIFGHSSGGQIVSRFAFFSKTATPADGFPRIRFVPSNPSSFLYLDGRRFDPATLTFKVPSADVVRACPGYDTYQFGLGQPLPSYADGRDVKSLVASFRARDVRYLIGNNDTCNENLIPGCESHGLETTCGDMQEGRFRRERGQVFFAYLKTYFGEATHALRLVPDTGHDHTLIMLGSLPDLFATPEVPMDR